MSTQDPIEILFHKFLHDQNMTAAEIRQLQAYVQDEQQQARLEAMLTALYEEDITIHSTAESNAKGAFAEVWDKLQTLTPGAVAATSIDVPRAGASSVALPVTATSGETSPVGAKEVPLRPRRRWWTYAAAAAVLLCTAAAGTYWWYQHQPATQPTVQSPASPTLIQPGGNKAVLTLADGSVIALDEAQNGMLGQQGNARIVKRANGQLAYEVAGDTKTTAILYNTISTPRGGKFHITLPDGSKVWLNAASSLRYPTTFTGNTREVTLTGEAYFEVAKNAAMPFHVRTDKVNVEVLGTHFNIMAYADEGSIHTTLLEGKVKVTAAPQTGQPMKQSPAILTPGQQASLVRHNGVLTINKEADTEEAIAWKNDQVLFAGKGVREAMRMIARWYDVDVEYKGNVPDVHFRGEIANNVPITQVLDMMEQTGEVHFEVTGKKIIVTP